MNKINLKEKLALLTVLLAGCAAAPTEPDEPLVWTKEWFQCDGRFDCIVVYDAWCKFTPVNATYARKYEFWAHDEVRRVGEQQPCPPAAGQPVPLPYCHDKLCDLR